MYAIIDLKTGKTTFRNNNTVTNKTKSKSVKHPKLNNTQLVAMVESYKQYSSSKSSK